MSRFAHLAPLLLFAGTVACENSESGTSNGDVANQAPPIIAAIAPPYRVVSVTAGGTVEGTVTLTGPAPADAALRVTVDAPVCGDRVEIESDVNGDRVANAVVWLEGIVAGKPMSEIKRYEVTQVRCVLEPRVQAVSTGGTLNVRSRDPLVHRTRFTSQPAGALISLVSHVDAGQVVPDEKIPARAGLVEIKCDEHPWTHGWLAVFDHPYYTVTGADGSFSFDDVPPGDYSLVVWHERGGRSVTPVKVAAGERVAAPVSIKLR